MPLGERAGDKSESRYCGVETEFSDDMPNVLAFNLTHGSFDFVVATLMDPAYRPSLMQKNGGASSVLPFAGSDLVLSPAQWSSHVVGKISSWIDLDSEDEILRSDSEITLKQEIAWASHLSLQACLLPSPKGKTCANYARCVNQILQGLQSMQLWLRIPLVKTDNYMVSVNSDDLDDSWETWNSFRLLCEHHSQLSVVLDVSSSLPSTNSLGRWFGESVRAAIFCTDSFLTNPRGYPCLSKRHQKLVSGFFNHSIQIVLSGQSVHSLTKMNSDIAANNNENNVDGVQKHPLRPYLDYVGFLYQRMDPLPEQERFELGYRDFLQSPLQPLMDNLEAQTYETFEKDTTKYIQYQRAIAKALQDRVPDEKSSTVTTVLMVVGAGRGPLVRASLQAAEETGRRLKVYAVEKKGLSTAGVLLLLGATGLMSFLYRFIPLPVVRGVQLSQGLAFAFSAIKYIRFEQDLAASKSGSSRPWLGLDGLIVALSALLFLILTTGSGDHSDQTQHTVGSLPLSQSRLRRRLKILSAIPAALIVFLFGLVLCFIRDTSIFSDLKFGPSKIQVLKITWEDWKIGFLRGAIPQIPLSILNSVIAVCKLSGDLFPDREASARTVSISVGIMNFVGCWFGAMPVCHGAGGLAGQYRFGARSGASVVFLGIGKLVLALVFGNSFVIILNQFPIGILGVLLLFAGIELAMASKDMNTKEESFVMLVCAAVSLTGSSSALGFGCGIVLFLVLKLRQMEFSTSGFGSPKLKSESAIADATTSLIP